MRKLIKEFVKITSGALPILEPIYEFGSLQVPRQERFADLRYLFPSKEYVGVDMQKGPGVDIILNLHHIDLPSESIGTILLLDTLEHVEFPRKAMKEIYRILKPNGLLIMSSVMNFPIHEFPYDYWRFTPQGFQSLLKTFAFSFVDSLGNQEFPHTIIGLASKKPISNKPMDNFIKQLGIWKEQWNQIPQIRCASPPMWKKLIRQVIPPIAINIYRNIRRYKNGQI